MGKAEVWQVVGSVIEEEEEEKKMLGIIIDIAETLFFLNFNLYKHQYMHVLSTLGGMSTYTEKHHTAGICCLAIRDGELWMMCLIIFTGHLAKFLLINVHSSPAPLSMLDLNVSSLPA